MPAQRAAAAFEPISPDLDLDALVEATPNFHFATRISLDMIQQQGLDNFERLVYVHVIQGGKPLVIEGYQHQLDPWTFSPQWLRDNYGHKYEQARDLNKQENLPLSIKHYLDNMSKLTNQWTPQNYRDTHRQRLYLKDIDCPALWFEKLKELLPASVLYLNDSTGDFGGQGAIEEQNPSGVGVRLGRGAAHAGDLMSCMPPPMRAENLMCYIGHEGTYTPAHREMCASLGQNIMVEASGSVGEDGKPTKPGSSIWFMTEAKDRHLVSEYWLSTLGHDIEVEKHFAQINAWKRAPFKVFIVDQRHGDFILIPPLAPHQVWNRGTRTMKVAWNRTTAETLDMALHEALPRARLVCRDEQYKNKSIILFTLNRYSATLARLAASGDQLLAKSQGQSEAGRKIRQLQRDFRLLFRLFTEIMVSEMFSPYEAEKMCELIPYDSNITCSYCRGNIFNRFLTCKRCIIPLEGGGEDTYDVCMDCFALGRSCACRSNLSWAEQFPFMDLVDKYNIWRRQVQSFVVGIQDPQPQALDDARLASGKKPLAEICQEQLKIRPFHDVNKADSPNEEDEVSDTLNDDGTPKKKRRRKSAKWLKSFPACHICGSRHPRWRVATCECGLSFCYGSLWRGFDLTPPSIMEQRQWRCPRCRLVCTCSACCKDPKNRPHEPHATNLGHDTRNFADPRSKEHLVDFSTSNMHWLNKAGDDNPDVSRRILRRQDEAESSKAKNISTEGFDGNGDSTTPTLDETIPLDPSLCGETASVTAESTQPNVRQAAADALQAMNGLSTLEQDPGAFIVQAGLERPAADAPPNHAYTYPDPEAGQPAAQRSGRNDAIAMKNPRRKSRAKEDALPDGVNPVSHKFHQELTQRTMEEAKKQGHSISARAAITGHSKFIILRLRPSALASVLPNAEPQEAAVQATEIEAPSVQIESDFPHPKPTKPKPSKTTHVSKKRRPVEVDEDFAHNWRAGRKQAAARRAAQRQDVETHQASSSESEEGNENLTEKNATQSRRSLPEYLARRSPVDTTELPKELTGLSRRSKPSPVRNPRKTTPDAPEEKVAGRGFDVQRSPGPDANNVQLLSQPKTRTSPRDSPSLAQAIVQPEAASAVTDAVPTSNAPRNEADKNRIAKMRALQGVDGGFDSDDSSDTTDTPASATQAIQFTASENLRGGAEGAAPELQTAKINGDRSNGSSAMRGSLTTDMQPQSTKSASRVDANRNSQSVTTNLTTRGDSVVRRGRGRPSKSTLNRATQSIQAATSLTMPSSPVASRKSIFATRGGRGRVKITSARSQA